MKTQSAFQRAKDQRVAADPTGIDPRLMCSAHGCPNRWSTSDGNLCRWHAASESHHWPRITQEQLEAETDRAMYAGMDRPESTVEPMTLAQKKAIAKRLEVALETAKKNPRAWIDRLEKRKADGYTLSAAQKHALEQVRKPLDSGDIA